MSLLYADLPEKATSPERPDRRRVETLIGLAAAIGGGVAGVGVVNSLLRNRRGDGDGWAAASRPVLESMPTGVERVVAPVFDEPLLIGPVSEAKFEPIDKGEAALAAVDSIPDPAPLPGTGTTPRPVDALPAPIELEPIAPVDVAPPSTVPPTGTPPTSTVPGTVPPTTTAPTTTTPPTTAPPTAGPAPVVRQLALTAGFNLTSEMSRSLTEMGLEGWVEAQLQPESVADPIVDDALIGFDLLDADPSELSAGGLGPTALSQIRWAGFVRMLAGERQVLDQMTALWREFFAVHGEAADLVGLEQTVRRHALGPYADLLQAVLATSAVQSAFGLADGASTEDLVDSSLAREVLERFTLGSADLFDDAHIEPLAADLAGDAVTSGLAVAELCRRHETGRHVATIVGRHFLGRNISSAAVESAEAVYAASGGDIGAVVRAVLLGGVGAHEFGRTRSGELWLHGALRAIGAEVLIGGEWNADDPGSLPGMLRTLGAEPGTGVTNDDSDWETPAAIKARWTVAWHLVGGGGAGVSVDLAGLAPDSPLPATAVISGISERLGLLLAERESDALLNYLGVDGGDSVGVLDPATVADLAALVISFPSFQKRDGGRS